jgi:hypothetical protein
LRKSGFDYTDIAKCGGDFFLETFSSLISKKGLYYNHK